MIQRLQSLWLFLAAIFAVLTYELPFYSGTKLVSGLPQSVKLTANENIILLILTGIVTLFCIIDIFLYKNRKNQLSMTIFTLILSLVLLVVYFLQIQKFENGEIALWCIFAFAIPVFLILAARGMYKDEKLIKSLDRLR
jgi:hypothetical protein